MPAGSIIPLPLSTYEDGPEERFVNRESFDNRAPLLAISVNDTGPGIPPEAVGKMFRERFTTKAPDKGTGLGLSIVRRLATEAKAAVHLKTKIGQGSTFTVVVRMRS